MRRGYTLFEVLVVVAILSLMAAMAVPSINTMYADSRLEAAADQVAGQWSAMRARAITEGRPYRFAIQPGGGDFRVAPDGAAFWAGGDAPAVSNDPNGPLVVQDSLPSGIRFASVGGDDPTAAPANSYTGEVADASATGSGSWTTVAVFLPDGTAQRDQEITFRSELSGPLSLRLRALTGGMSTRWGQPDQGP